MVNEIYDMMKQMMVLMGCICGHTFFMLTRIHDPTEVCVIIIPITVKPAAAER